MTAIAFIVPLMIVYEWSAAVLRPIVSPETDLLAPKLIEGLLGWIGVAGQWLPAGLLILALIVWQVRIGSSWWPAWWALPPMVVESLLLALPMLVLNGVLLMMSEEPLVPSVAHASTDDGWSVRVVRALGAGIYEEFLFRFFLVGGALLALRQLPRPAYLISGGAAILLASVTFGLCHFVPLGSYAFSWRRFLFFLAAGVYLSIVFWKRGLPIAIGCHAGYNLLLVAAGRE
jgi:membrane protease YdiL (CAAX protease family)